MNVIIHDFKSSASSYRPVDKTCRFQFHLTLMISNLPCIRPRLINVMRLNVEHIIHVHEQTVRGHNCAYDHSRFQLEHRLVYTAPQAHAVLLTR